jgi:hypothetical protein
LSGNIARTTNQWNKNKKRTADSRLWYRKKFETNNSTGNFHPRIGEAETEERGPRRPSFELQVFNCSTVYLLNLRSLDLASSGRLMDSSLTYRISIQYS